MSLIKKILLYPIRSIQLFYWLFFKPSSVPDFKLIDLKWHDLLNKDTEFLILQSYAVLAVFGGLVGYLLVLAFNFNPSADIVLSSIGALGFALVLGIAVGITCSAALGAASTGLFAIAGFFLFAEPYDIALGSMLALCFVVGMVGHLVTCNFSQAMELSWSNRVGTVILSLLLSIVFSVVLILIAISLQSLFDVFYEQNSLKSTRLTLITIALFSLLLLFIKSIHNKFVLTYISSIMLLGMIAFFSTSQEFDKLSIGILNAVMISTFLLLPTLIIGWLVPKQSNTPHIIIMLGIATGVLVAALCWSTIAALINAETGQEWHYILSGLGAALVSFFLLRILLVLPFSVAWNSLIYFIASYRLANHQSFNIKLHSIFWDDFYYQIDKAGLKEYFKLFVAEQSEGLRASIKEIETRLANETKITKEIRYLIDTVKLEKVDSLNDIANAHQQLAGLLAESPWLQHFNKASVEVSEALQKPHAYDQIELLEITLLDLSETLEILKNQPAAADISLIPAYEKWYKIISNYQQSLTKFVKAEALIKSPYVVGQPVDNSSGSAAFVGRASLIEEIKRTLKQGQSIFIHGYPRIGKTSLLKNLATVLPEHFICVQLDFQNIVPIAKNTDALFFQIARRISKALTKKDIIPPEIPEFADGKGNAEFATWLDAVKALLKPKMLVLMFDEFTKLKLAIEQNKADYDEAILTAMTSWIQPKSHLQIILVGHVARHMQESPTLANKLVFKQLSYLEETAAQTLIRQPTLDFLLRYTDEAVQKIIAITQSHPAYIQLLCRDIINEIKNTQAIAFRLLVTLKDVEQAIPHALEKGGNILGTVRNQLSDLEMTLIKSIARQGKYACAAKSQLTEQYPDSLESMTTKLINLGLLKYVSGDDTTEEGYQFQVELTRAWYALES